MGRSARNDEALKEAWASHLLRLSRGFMASRVFLTAVELNVFSLLGAQPLTSVEMASLMSADARATEILLDALASIGLLEKNGDRYANVRVQGEPLLVDSLDGLGGFGHAVHLWEASSHLTEIVRSGCLFIGEWSDDARRDFSLCMRHLAQGMATTLARVVDFSDVGYMLDLGGGTGAYAIALARHHRQMRVVLFDRDRQALELAREEIARESLKDRISLKRGDFWRDDMGQGYDLALLSSVICLFGEEQNLALLRGVLASLASGGKIVILDSMVDSSHTRPAAAALCAVSMLITSHGGRSYSHNQVEGWLRRVGFEETRRIPLGGSQVIVAMKGSERESG